LHVGNPGVFVMQATLLIVVLWAAFAASHAVLSATPVRRKLVAVLGEWPFVGLYSAVAFATFVPLVWIYFENKHAGPLLWSVPINDAVRGLLYLGNALAFILIAAGYVSPSPAVVGSKRVLHRPVHDITRHPVFMGIGLWGLVHLVPNGYASDVAFFAGFPLFALLGSWHQDLRLKKSRGTSYRRFLSGTPFLPLTGKHTWRGLRHIPYKVTLAGISVAVVLGMFHARWFI
jgi:uncharacterized membrane protein